MDTATASASAAHLVAVPYPGRGHVNGLLNFCDILLRSAGTPLIITFVVTEEWLALITSSQTYSPHPWFQFRTVPNVIPSERIRGADHPGFVRAVLTKVEPHFDQLLATVNDPQPTAIVADTFLPWVVDLGNRKGVPVYSFFPMPPQFFSFMFHYGRLVEQGIVPARPSLDGDDHMPAGGSNREQVTHLKDGEGDDFTEYFPGTGCGVQLEDFSSIVRYSPVPLGSLSIPVARRAQGLIFNAVYELHIPIINSLRAAPDLPLPVYSIGPCVPRLHQEPSAATTTLSPTPAAATVDYVGWLDSRPTGSVLYISLGSFMPISAEQMEELAHGLAEAGVHFLWVLRENCRSPILLELLAANAGRGITVPWCEQMRVLCHPSVGAFLTHCGWNSTLEGLSAGKPMLAMPIFWDQPMNSALISKCWGVGLRLKEAGKEKEVVRRAAVSAAVRKVMGPAGDEFRRRASELKDVCRCAFREATGSSLMSLHAFVQDVLAGKRP